MNNKRIPQNSDFQYERNKEEGGPQKIWADEVEEDLKIMKIRCWHAVAGDWKDRRRIALEVEGHNGL
jgi:hypothetical protein